ncbi:hypothetical protein CERSUDRAFT_59448 [Gelatoporia subvermispora B]|uniref:DUF6589 domain-containing protein n=1 Tax=Ceriporiopsis subvermispora (strain B) TaxID=914234 RepID=M2R0S6_CERS8|nr:hypothetical protein CERSUDRAFT_59448 [Gelatoporia subvermispora B]
MNRRQRFQAWKFLADLVHHGPEYFRQFKADLGEPEPVEKIPVVQSKQVPLRAMDINESTTAGNGEALTDIFKQANIGSHAEDGMQGRRDIGDHVILVHGDLATGERIDALQRSRSEEKTSWRKYQHVIFVMGLFHLKMACAEAVWKLCIVPKAARADKTCLMAEVAAIRPKETRKVISKPGFRRMHEIIQHVGIVSRLDCWRVEVKRRYSVNSLENWAKTKPTWEILKDIAKTLVKDYVAGSDLKRQRSEPRERRDEQRENAMVRQQLYMYYEEISGAMNAGDIGCVEQCFLPWILVFKGCGKHKYATHMLRILHNLYFVYPAGLR